MGLSSSSPVRWFLLFLVVVALALLALNAPSPEEVGSIDLVHILSQDSTAAQTADDAMSGVATEVEEALGRADVAGAVAKAREGLEVLKGLVENPDADPTEVAAAAGLMGTILRGLAPVAPGEVAAMGEEIAGLLANAGVNAAYQERGNLARAYVQGAIAVTAVIRNYIPAASLTPEIVASQQRAAAAVQEAEVEIGWD